MKLADLSRQVIEKIKSYQWDRFIEKHEGPIEWSSVLQYHDPEFMEINGCHVLLPVNRNQHRNIKILRHIIGDNGQSLILFLKDTTFIEDPKEERFLAGFVAICDKVPGENFFITIFYHEWFIIENK